MKFQNKLQLEIVTHLMKDDRLVFKGYNGTFHFQSYNEKYFDNGHFDFSKTHGDKSSGEIRILIYTDRFKTENVEFKIEGYLSGYQSEETFFQGWVSSMEEFKTVLKCIGVSKQNETNTCDTESKLDKVLKLLEEYKSMFMTY